MSEAAGAEPLDWTHLDALSDAQIASLVDSALFVLRQAEGADAPPAQMPRSAMTRALEQSLAENGADPAAAGRLAQDETLSRPVAIALLQTIGQEPALTAEVERVWRDRSGMLVLGVGEIAALSLLLLVLKLKKMKGGRGGWEVDFDRLTPGMLKSVFKVFG